MSIFIDSWSGNECLADLSDLFSSLHEGTVTTIGDAKTGTPMVLLLRSNLPSREYCDHLVAVIEHSLNGRLQTSNKKVG